VNENVFLTVQKILSNQIRGEVMFRRTVHFEQFNPRLIHGSRGSPLAYCYKLHSSGRGTFLDDDTIRSAIKFTQDENTEIQCSDLESSSPNSALSVYS
jgi:hypothetical protein